MNLYEIRFTHYSQKDNKEGIHCFLVAENNEHVYDWLASDDTVVPCWNDREEDEVIYDRHDDEYNIIGTETIKERFCRN